MFYEDKMYETIKRELEKRYWGISVCSNKASKKHRFIITDYRGLMLSIGIARYYYKKHSHERLFYRGQTQDWPLRPSLYRCCKNKNDLKKYKEWHDKAMDAIEKEFDPKGTPEEREARAQHYGLPTEFIDVVDHAQAALWFACNETDNEARQDESVGYIYVIRVPEDAKIIDLRDKPSEWLRPHLQQAFCVRFLRPDKKLGDLSDYRVMTLIIPKEELRKWSNYDNVSCDKMFPNEQLDSGLVYWEKARKLLQNKKMINDKGELLGEEGIMLCHA